MKKKPRLTNMLVYHRSEWLSWTIYRSIKEKKSWLRAQLVFSLVFSLSLSLCSLRLSSLHYLSFVYDKNLPLPLSNPLRILSLFSCLSFSLSQARPAKSHYRHHEGDDDDDDDNADNDDADDNGNDTVITLHSFPVLAKDDRTVHAFLLSLFTTPCW